MSRDAGGSLPRRDFLKTSAAVTAATMASGMLTSGVFAQGDDTIRVGLVGCGGRGKGAAGNACAAADGVELYAMGDLFPDKLAKGRNDMKEHLGDKYNV
ncbi:MAG TPA: twin-arginine translocation signal domain-containing protein, partial [Armatimonadota bacterium]|nr:twin-arginine translocation signal domain-containing protein [Armatimonadota bacterium]